VVPPPHRNVRHYSEGKKNSNGEAGEEFASVKMSEIISSAVWDLPAAFARRLQ
jgi:hypothetical protein